MPDNKRTSILFSKAPWVMGCPWDPPPDPLFFTQKKPYTGSVFRCTSCQAQFHGQLR